MLMTRWRTAVGGLGLIIGLIIYLIFAVWLIGLTSEGGVLRWALYLTLSWLWIFPCLRLSRWTLRGPGTKIEDIQR